jgi:hypothetical protein
MARHNKFRSGQSVCGCIQDTQVQPRTPPSIRELTPVEKLSLPDVTKSPQGL